MKSTGKEIAGLLAGGFALGTAGVKLFTSKDAKKAYSHITAAFIRCKDCIMTGCSKLQENAGDILADAKDINAKREAAEEAETK